MRALLYGASCFSLFLFLVGSSNAACPELSKTGDQVVVAFRGGPLLRGKVGNIRVTRETDGVTAVDTSSSVMIDGDRLLGPFLLSEGNGYRVWRYDPDLKQVLANFPPGTVRVQASINIQGQKPVTFPVEYKTLGETDFAIGACVYHAYNIAKTIVREDENGVYFSSGVFVPKLGLYVRSELQSGSIGQPLSNPRMLYEVTGFSGKSKGSSSSR